MKILHVVAGLPPTGGGLSEFVPRLAIEAGRLGHDVTLATIASRDEPLSHAATEAALSGVSIVRFAPSAPRAVFFSWDMLRGLPALAHAADIVHVHSNWTFPVWWGCRCALDAGKPLVMSPHGCLDPVRLAHSAWKKRLAGLFDRRYLRQAAAIHATSDMERDWIECYLGKGSQIFVTPSGVELSTPKPPATQLAPRTRKALYLGRMHPLKGLDLLLEAWKQVAADSQWQLVIAGPDEQGTRAALEAEALALGLKNVVFSGPLHGEEKWQAFADADVFVLPSRSENFGIAVVEALAAGIPVITTKGAPWSEIKGRCGWWVDVNADAIAQALSAAMHLSDAERAAMGNRGRELAAEKYQWDAVGRAMAKVYKSLIGR